MTQNTCHITVGRLMEIDVAAGYRSVADVDEMIGMIAGELARLPKLSVIVAADWRPCGLFTPDVAERAIKMLSSVNDRIERSAIIHRVDQPTSVLQVMRLIREAKYEHRRVFTE